MEKSRYATVYQQPRLYSVRWNTGSDTLLNKLSTAKHLHLQLVKWQSLSSMGSKSILRNSNY